LLPSRARQADRANDSVAGKQSSQNKYFCQGIKVRRFRSCPCVSRQNRWPELSLEGHMTDASAKKSEFGASTVANGGLRLFGPDVEMIFASHHKNFEAMMQANRVTLDGVQAIWCRQLDFIQQTVEGLTTLAREVAQPSSLTESELSQKVAGDPI
jgi:hypothetical protein